MSDEEKRQGNTSEILTGFAQLLTQHQTASEERQAVSDKKLDRLVESVTTLNESHIETRKDREFDMQRMERLEQNQKDQGKELSTIANSMILVNERQSNSKSSWDRVLNITTAISVAGVLAYLGLK